MLVVFIKLSFPLSFFASVSHNISRIESQSPDATIDSRKIVNLVFVASDKRVVNPF